MSLYSSRNGAILWQELPEFLRLFDNPTWVEVPDPASPGDTIKIKRPGDLRAYLDAFGYLLDRYDATLSQFYADGFTASDPVQPDAREIQPWLVPYFADLFGITLFAPDPESRRSELSQSIWVARRRGTRLAVDRAAESILGRGVVAVAGLDRIAFSPTLKRPLLTAQEITGESHLLDPVILHEPLAADPTISGLRLRHPALALGTRDTRRRMRAMRAAGFVLDSDSKPTLSDTGDPIAVRFVVQDRAGFPCFPGSYEDRALRTPDIRAPGPARGRAAGLARPDAVILHVDPPPGVFDHSLQPVDAVPAMADGGLVPHEPAPDPGKRIFYAPTTPNPQLRATLANGRDGTRFHEVDDLVFDGTVAVAANNTLVLNNFAVRRIIVRAGAVLIARNGLCETIEAADMGASCTLEYVTITESGAFRQLNGSEVLARALSFTASGDPGCLRYSRYQDGTLRADISTRATAKGPFHFLNWPCLPDPADAGAKIARPANFGEPGWGVLSPGNPEQVRTGAEDGSELGGYHGRFHLARLAAAERRAESFAPAGHRVFAQYDLRSAAPLPSVTET